MNTALALADGEQLRGGGAGGFLRIDDNALLSEAAGDRDDLGGESGGLGCMVKSVKADRLMKPIVMPAAVDRNMIMRFIGRTALTNQCPVRASVWSI